MRDDEIEALADSVLSLYRLSPPVDLVKLAKDEGVELVEGDFGSDFHGRIEYLQDERVFAIYHPGITSEIFPGRVRFTIAHELGHYFIPAHRDVLLKVLVHDSDEDFRTGSSIEKQADRFAAALLLPGKLLKEKMGRKGFLSLAEIKAVASNCCTSLQAAAFRYTQFTTEPHLAIVSEDRKILYYFASEEAQALGFAGLGNRLVPENSPTVHASSDPLRALKEGATSSEAWFSERYKRADLWEEAVSLGYSGRALTLLSWQNSASDHDC
ncbi:conserved hypothetical protein [uncultured Defluviicoccus sp.]|uniref:IrrE N-terminal-like domain-containing protein n=1 Tax=metagenome TaxID=256318 RepID=A0A380TFJ7_9ZZZZ|nr:conserved hypothetical protein [uncultured Defluviicoccus sp.]